MSHACVPITILLADDDPDDRLLLHDAIEEARLGNPVHFVHDGVELMDYLNRRRQYVELASSPYTGLILLDLNMPRKDGLEVLEEIKTDPRFRRIPVVVLSTSKAEEDILRTYDLGVNSFIVKPVTFDSLVETMRTVTRYWLQIVSLPPNAGGAC